MKILFYYQGALIGYLCGVVLTSWICVGAMFHPLSPNNLLQLPLSIDGCIDMNATTEGIPTIATMTAVMNTTTESAVDMTM